MQRTHTIDTGRCARSRTHADFISFWLNRPPTATPGAWQGGRLRRGVNQRPLVEYRAAP
ncbi:hypothetical protein BJY59DRAFT_700673 [Rhodotorula toruloides]